MPKQAKSEYAKSGVDYSVMEPFKMAMIETGKKTLKFPEKRGVFINQEISHAHGAVFEYKGGLEHLWCKTQEDLGNKNWIAEWMYENEGIGKTYYDSIAIDTVLMTVNDVIAQGAMPVVFTDQIEASNSDWYADEKRANDLAAGFFKICEEVGMALPAGESATLKYIVNPLPPVKMVATLSGCTTGIIAPKNRLVTGRKLRDGDHIIAAASSGIHSNGISLVIKKTMELADKFLTKLPDGRILGHEALIPTRSYAALVEALLKNEIEIHSLLPGTGDGVGKIAFDKRSYAYRIHSWPEVPALFRYFNEQLNVPLKDCLKTFNWGAGYYIYVPAEEAKHTIEIGQKAGYEMMDVGLVEKGERKVVIDPGIFNKEGIILPPPGG